MFGTDWVPNGFESFLSAQLATPVNSAFTAGVGTLPNATYFYRVSAINARGETLASTETSLAIAAGPQGVNVNWGAVGGATGYKIYGRTTGAEQLIATVGAVTTYLDGGAIVPSGALPAFNTTAQLILPARTEGLVIIAETQNLRYRFDSAVPTAGAGNGVLLKTTDNALPILGRQCLLGLRIVEEVGGARATAHYFARAGQST